MTYDDHSTTLLLRDLDAADHDLSDQQLARRTLTLESILAVDPETAGPLALQPRSSRRGPRALLLTGGLVAAVTAAAVVVPVLTRHSEAFATWSPTPVELHGADRAAALEACLLLQEEPDGELAFAPDAPASAEIAEARGGWQYVVLTVTAESGRELRGSCLMPDELVDRPVAEKGGFFGSLSDAEEVAGPPPAAGTAHEDVFGAGSVDDDLFVYAEGRAGADVVSIEVTTPGGQHVEASVEGGHWAAWWPGGDASPRNPEISEAPTYEVTLRDGTLTGMQSSS